MDGKTIIDKSFSGFALTELIMVIAIISILLGVATISFHQWQLKYKVEAQVKEMSSDFSELRVRAMTRKQRHSITVNQSNYIFKSYSSDDEPLSAGTVIPPAIRSVYCQLKTGISTFYNGQVFEIDHRGMLVDIPVTTGTIFLDDNNSGAAIDCLTIHTVRINPGKKNSDWSSCDDR